MSLFLGVYEGFFVCGGKDLLVWWDSMGMECCGGVLIGGYQFFQVEGMGGFFFFWASRGIELLGILCWYRECFTHYALTFTAGNYTLRWPLCKAVT